MASGAGVRGHGHYSRVVLIFAFSIGGNGTWRSVGSGERGKAREIVLQSILAEWDFELKTTEGGREKIVTANRRHYFGLLRGMLVSGIFLNTNEARGCVLQGCGGG